MMFYLIMPPLALAWYILYAYLILKNVNVGGHWFWIAWAVGCAPIWLVSSRFSKDIYFDGMLYDALMFIGYALGTLYFTNKMQSLGFINYCGMVLIVIGFFLVKSK